MADVKDIELFKDVESFKRAVASDRDRAALGTFVSTLTYLLDRT